MGCGYSRGSSSPYSYSDSSLKQDGTPGILFLVFGTLLVLCILIPFISSLCEKLLYTPPKTKITDYYQPRKIDNKTSRGPYKHMED